ALPRLDRGGRVVRSGVVDLVAPHERAIIERRGEPRVHRRRADLLLKLFHVVLPRRRTVGAGATERGQPVDVLRHRGTVEWRLRDQDRRIRGRAGSLGLVTARASEYEYAGEPCVSDPAL